MEQETDYIHFYALANSTGGHRILKVVRHELCGPPDHLMGKYLDHKIVAYTEQRQHFWAYQPESWVTYHVCTIFEVDCSGNKLFILIERVDDKLEIMFGMGYVPRSFMLELRATGKHRRSDRCHKQPRQVVAPRVTVRRLFEWLGHSLARRWQPYHILHSNCQHVAEELQRYVRDPSSTIPVQLEDEIVPVPGLCAEVPSSLGAPPSPLRTSHALPATASRDQPGALRSSSFGVAPRTASRQRTGSFSSKAAPRCGSFEAAPRCGSFGTSCTSTGIGGCSPSRRADTGSQTTLRQVKVKKVGQTRHWSQQEQEDDTCTLQ